MALIKEIEINEYGISASYWKVRYFTIDTKAEEVNFTLELLAKKGAKEGLKTFCVSELMGIEDKTMYNKYFAEDKGKTYKDWQTACYMYVKENIEFFKDAVDDEEEIALKNNI